MYSSCHLEGPKPRSPEVRKSETAIFRNSEGGIPKPRHPPHRRDRKFLRSLVIRAVITTGVRPSLGHFAREAGLSVHAHFQDSEAPNSKSPSIRGALMHRDYCIYKHEWRLKGINTFNRDLVYILRHQHKLSSCLRSCPHPYPPEQTSMFRRFPTTLIPSGGKIVGYVNLRQYSQWVRVVRCLSTVRA